jgi:uncharacterized protein
MSDDSNTQFNVAQLLKSAVGGTRHYDVEATVPSLDKEVALTRRITGEVRFTRTQQGILVQGHFESAAELTCVRCLDQFASTIEFDLEEEFIPTVDVNTGRWLELEETDPALLINEHHLLDLEEVFRQAILLSVPMHPVCRSGCAGLCPRCGKNLNEGPCNCAQDEVDPRWEKLRELK